MAQTQQELRLKITTDARQAEADLKAIDRMAKAAEANPVELPVRTEGTDKVEADLKAVGEAAEQASRKVEDMGKAGGAGGGLRNVKPAADEASAALQTTERSADGTKNAFANLVGNSAQDLTGMLGPLGSVGVAIGQVAEYTTDAANESGNLKAALSGAAGVALPVAGLSAALLVVTNIMETYKKRQAEIKKAHEEGAAAFEENTGAIKDWGDALDEAFDTGTANSVEVINKAIKDALGKDATSDAIRNLVTLGKSADDLGQSMLDADQDFRSFAEGQLVAAGATEKQAKLMTDLIRDSGSAATAMALMQKANLDPKAMGLEDTVSALSELNQEARKQDFEKYADDALKSAEGVKATSEAAKEARASTANATDAWRKYSEGQQEAARRSEENARAAEEGARAVEAAGTILERAQKQTAAAHDQLTEAQEKALKAQEDWLNSNVNAQGSVDEVTSALGNLREAQIKQKEEADKGTQSALDKIEADIGLRDAEGAVYKNALDVIQSYKDQGITAQEAKKRQEDLAQQQYDLAIAMGFPQEEAQKIRDKILQIPTSVTTEVQYSEIGYEERLAEQERLERDIHNTVYFAGVVDRSLQRAIDMINWNAPPGTVVTPGMAPAPAAVGATAVAPMAAPITRTSTVPVTINVNAGMVADTYQLQRAVTRSARSFQRLAGKRAAA